MNKFKFVATYDGGVVKEYGPIEVESSDIVHVTEIISKAFREGENAEISITNEGGSQSSLINVKKLLDFTIILIKEGE